MNKNFDKIICDKKLQSQCLSQLNSNSCKLRFFNGRCLMAERILKKEKEKELQK